MDFSFKIHTIWCITLLSIFKIEKVRFGIHQEHFLTLEDVPDSWDVDGDPKVVSMWCPWSYFSCGKGFGLIPSSSSEIFHNKVYRGSGGGGEEGEEGGGGGGGGGIYENKGSVSLTVSGQVNPWTNVMLPVCNNYLIFILLHYIDVI